MESCDRRNVVPGIHMRSPTHLSFWRKRGMRLLSCSSEATMLLERATQVFHEITADAEK
jgi:hypothetical protein